MTNRAWEIAAEQIKKASDNSHKSYQFDETHDATRPAEYWFQESEEGTILFVVFYTQACRWSRCLGCNLPSKMSINHVGFDSIMAQIDCLISEEPIQQKRLDIKKVIVSNNGSVLDQVTFSSTALMYLIACLNRNFPNLTILSMESRPEYVEIEELEFISRALAEGETPTTLEIAIGFEAFNEKIRNDVFDKGLSLEKLENFTELMAPYGFHIKCYFMLKPVPNMSNVEAIQDICQAIDYLSSLQQKHNLHLNMHINPTYAAKGTPLETAFVNGSFTPPTLTDLVRTTLHGKGKNITIFLGLSDEGLACPGGSFLRPGEEKIVKKLELFNKTQDYSILENILTE